MSATDKPSDNPETPKSAERSHEVPQRVQINSRPLLAELEFMTAGFHCTDYDGEFVGAYFGAITFTFRDYKGEKPVTDLEFYPADFDPDYAQRRQHLIDRGRKVLELLQPSHRYYSGLTLDEDPEDIDGEVVIDPKTAYEMEPEYIKLKSDGISLITTSTQSAEYYETTGCGDESCMGCTNNWDDNLLEQKSYDDYSAEEQGLRGIWTPDVKIKITDEHLVYMPKDILGFVLRTRTWKWLDIELVRRVEDQEQEERLGFEELVINEKHKSMVLALVQSHHSGPRTEAGGSMDLVKGKGRGLIILLHGAPGVGKTSTAETVAYTKRPLYPITCGDIGEKADQVERTLEKHFKLAHKWGCVLLLDEADVFLAKRAEGDVQRNALVSVDKRIAQGKTTRDDAAAKKRYRTVRLTAEHFERVAEVTTEYHRYVKRM
ncbi:hypothetical protein SLS58_010546 [Diplodia intermedia]|uniref:AAA+ ATPase domain-containing protein n=1 Tax=Diplodia intermedia TaxID=856260 RepID=A0ABR3T621_9PEZI